MTLVEEVWKPVVGFEDFYEVSDTGRVFSLRQGKVMACTLSDQGYPRVTLCSPGEKRVNTNVHKLVGQAFDIEGSGTEIDHINRDRSDNRVCNLRWCSRHENQTNMSNNNPNQSGHNHITWHKQRGKWQVSIRLRGENYYGGLASTVEEALIMRTKLLKELE